MQLYCTAKEKWQRISSRATIIPVAKGDGHVFDNSGLSKKEVKLLGEDINYINTDKPLWNKIGEDTFHEVMYLYIIIIIFGGSMVPQYFESEHALIS